MGFQPDSPGPITGVDIEFYHPIARSAHALLIDRSKLNVKGSSLAVGHPFAATGARIVSTLGKIIDENNGGRGLISVCTAGGMGVTAIMER